ncbi:lipoyl synthase, putative [Babesia ovata]|uniref:Lipoyl synthase, putative n=1 Tax=Babesia ovata TaxID=189622 RepID=A0A2H6KEP8_9APIC|nr:lipoyl synthase, putative [Babesia ovata]GBE61471.1 lipoyl synthase, putative [Babesia ovata]
MNSEKEMLTLIPSTSGTPDAVHVVFDLVGEIEIHHNFDIAHIQTSGGDVRCDHDRVLAILEFVEHPVALLLLLVTVDAQSWPSVQPELPGERVCGLLRVSEDEHLGTIRDFSQNLLQLCAFLLFTNDIYLLRYVVASLQV